MLREMRYTYNIPNHSNLKVLSYSTNADNKDDHTSNIYLSLTLERPMKMSEREDVLDIEYDQNYNVLMNF